MISPVSCGNTPPTAQVQQQQQPPQAKAQTTPSAEPQDTVKLSSQE